MNVVTQSEKLIDGLKAALRSKRVTYKNVGDAIGMTEAGVKKALNSDSLSLNRMEQIAAMVGLSLWDLMRLCEQQDKNKQLFLSEFQETELASDEALFVVYCLVLYGWSAAEVIAEFKFSEREITQHLRKLKSLEIIDFDQDLRIQLLSASNPIWIEHGPLFTKYGAILAKEFVVEFPETANQRFLRGAFDSGSLELFKTKLQQLERDFALIAGDRDSGPGVTSYALFYSMRPWQFSVVESFRRDKSP